MSAFSPVSVVAAARAVVDDLRNRLLAGEPVAVELAEAVRDLERAVTRAEADPHSRPWVRWVARPGGFDR